LTNAQCASVPTSNDGNGISNVLLGATNFPNADVTYFDHTGTVVTLGQGITSTVQITFETGYTYDTNIWIDFNDDLTFDAGEQVFDGVSLVTNPTTLDASFVMPATAALGNHLMRIGTADFGQATPTSCYNGAWGVTLDFTVNIVGISCTPAVVASSVINADCPNDQFYIDIDVTSVGDATEVTDGTTTWPVTGTGVLQVGPYASGTTLDLTLTHSDNACDLGLGNFNYFCPPTNDLCGDAIAVNCGDTIIGNTDLATSDDEQGTCGTTQGAPGIWYSITGNGDIITASLCNSGYDTKIQIFEGSCAAMTCVNGNDDSCGLQSETLFVSTVGTEYYIYVYGYGTGTGDFELNLTCVTPPPAPANDDCATAIDLTVNTDLDCTDVTAGTIAGATTSAETDPTCFGSADDDVWYTFTATSDLHNVSLLNLVGSTTNVDFSIFEGACGTLTEFFCSNADSDTVAGLTIGNVYYVRVYSNTANPLQDTTFDICIGTPPPPITTDIVTYTPEQLVTDVLVDADCATVNNIQYETHSLGADIGFSYFTDGGSNFPFADGIILSSGAAAEAAGPFDGGGPSHAGNGVGDADLEAVTGVTNTHDRVYLEFDFVPLAPQISFNYIMASSEYNGNFECNYADSFAFILTNTTVGTAPVNLAKLPAPTNFNDTVVVTNIRPEVNAGCLAQNEHYFAGYTPESGEHAYGGMTVPLTAFSEVIVGDVYHIKLVMADQGDSAFDTAIFLEGGSFSLGSVDLGDDVFLGDPGALCEGDTKVLNAGVLPNGTGITWFKDGVEIPGETIVNVGGETEQTLTIDVTGDYSMSIYFVAAPDCARDATVHIEFYPNPMPNLGDDVIVCANEELILEANVENLTDPNMGTLNYVWEYNGVVVQNGPDSTLVIDATTVLASTNLTNGAVQYENPVDGSTTYANVVYSVNGVANIGVYHLGEFTVTATDIVTLCSGTSTMNVSYFENANCVSIPSGISPNGDGINDCLTLDHLSPNNGISRLQVFNRYGTRVYDNSNHVKSWCGTNQDGDVLDTATYYYVLDYQNGTQYRGWVYINVED